MDRKESLVYNRVVPDVLFGYSFDDITQLGVSPYG